MQEFMPMSAYKDLADLLNTLVFVEVQRIFFYFGTIYNTYRDVNLD